MAARALTLGQYIIQEERKHPEASGEFTSLLSDIALAAKLINREVTRAGLVDILGYTGGANVHGEKVQKLDLFAHEVIHQVLGSTGQLAVLASEEDEDIVHVPDGQPVGKYVVNFDPLDGSSNINANVNIGTIFSILPRLTRRGPGTVEDCLQAGRRQVAAGYVMYGSSTMLVFTTGDGVHGFTFEPSLGEFLLSHPYIKIPERGRIYSVNEGNYVHWHEGVKRYVDWLKREDPATGRPYSARYVGSLPSAGKRTSDVKNVNIQFPSTIQRDFSWLNATRMPSMPGWLFHPDRSGLSSGRSTEKRPMIAKRSGWRATASSA